MQWLAADELNKYVTLCHVRKQWASTV